MPSARIRSALPPLAIPENKTPGMLDFVQPHTLTAKIGNRRVPVRHGTRLYVPGMLSDADQAYVDRQEMAQRGRLGIIPIAAAVGVAKVASSFIHGSSPRYEGGPLVSTVIGWLSARRTASPASVRGELTQGAIGAGQAGWKDVGAVLLPALRPDVFPQGPARPLNGTDMQILSQAGGPVSIAPAPAPVVSTTPTPAVIPPQPAPVAYSPTGPGAVAPAPAPFSFFPTPAPAPAPAYPGAPTIITVPGAPAPAPVTESMIPTGGGSNLLPLALGAGLLLVMALSGKGK